MRKAPDPYPVLEQASNGRRTAEDRKIVGWARMLG